METQHPSPAWATPLLTGLAALSLLLAVVLKDATVASRITANYVPLEWAWLSFAVAAVLGGAALSGRATARAGWLVYAAGFVLFVVHLAING